MKVLQWSQDILHGLCVSMSYFQKRKPSEVQANNLMMVSSLNSPSRSSLKCLYSKRNFLLPEAGEERQN